MFSPGPIWGALGVLALLGQAVWRLTPLALDPIRHRMFEWYHWIIWAAWVALQAYSEGYRGFQKAFSPRVVARARHLALHPRPHHVLLAPLYCMAFFHATRRRLVTSYVFVVAIVILIAIVQQIQQPWRGIIDAGVVLGLVWGMVAIVVYYARAAAGHPLPVPADVPDAPEA